MLTQPFLPLTSIRTVPNAFFGHSAFNLKINAHVMLCVKHMTPGIMSRSFLFRIIPVTDEESRYVIKTVR